MTKGIAELQVGDYVLSRNADGVLEYKKVVNTFDNGTQLVKDYYLENDEIITCTPGHRFLSGGIYTPIEACESIDTIDGSVKVWDSADLREEHVYDIEVEDNHNFTVYGCLGSNCRAGAQVPFSSINYGTDTTAEGRMITKATLDATDDGLGGGETPIFPVQVFKFKRSVNGERGTPNYDLFQLSCKVSAKRLFPNYGLIDSWYNRQYYKEGHPETEMAVMGCASGQETITIKVNGEVITESFTKAWDRLSAMPFDHVTTSRSVYIKLYGVEILDRGSFVECKGILRNKDVTNWMVISAGDKQLTVTTDHPLRVNDTRMYAQGIKKDDVLYYNNQPVKVTDAVHFSVVMDSFDVETSSDRFTLSGFDSHNCRTRVLANDYDPEHAVTPGRGNFAFVTINLPALGIRAEHSVPRFFELFDEMIDACIGQLKDRFEYISHKHAYNFPFLVGQGVYLDSDKLQPDDEIGEIIKHASLSVGFIGLAECLVALIGKHHGESKMAQDLGLDIVHHLRKRMDQEIQKTGLNWSCFATPAEGLCSRAAKLNRKRFGLIPGVTDRDYVTNSSH